MTNILKLSIEATRKEYGLIKKEIDVFCNKLAVSFKGYLLFRCLDKNNQDCNLETLLPINLEIYKNYKFELNEEVKVPNTNLILNTILRKAKRKEETN